MNKHQRISAMISEGLRDNKVTSQYDACLLTAQCIKEMCRAPQTDGEYLTAAQGMAAGLFGDAYENGDYGAKSGWIDLCERALRAAFDAPMQP